VLVSKDQLALLQESSAQKLDSDLAAKPLGLDKSKAMAALDNLKNFSSAPVSSTNEKNKNSDGSSSFGSYTFS